MTDYSEEEIQPEVLRVLGSNPGLTVEEIIPRATAAMAPNGLDTERYPSRPEHEPRFDQKVRNVLRTSRPLIADGLVDYAGEEGERTYFLTPKGRLAVGLDA